MMLRTARWTLALLVLFCGSALGWGLASLQQKNFVARGWRIRNLRAGRDGELQGPGGTNE
jgi:hypothetical protein